MSFEICMYQKEIWLVDGVDPNSHKLIITQYGGSKTVTVTPDEVDYLDLGSVKDQIEEQSKIHDALKVNIQAVSQKRLEEARVRYNTIALEVSGEIDVESAAKECGISVSRYYEIRKQYDPRIGFTSVLSSARGRKSGETQISDEVEKIISEQIPLCYIGENPSFRNVWKSVQAICHDRGLTKPAYETVRERVKENTKMFLAEISLGKEYANDRFKLRGGTRELLRPLEQAQMDHTRVDCFIRSRKDPMKAVGRPWITLVVCAKTKVILGFFISFRFPSLGSVAIALKHAVTSKESFMKSIGLAGHPYPYFGVMEELLMDNAKEFRSPNLQRACVFENIKVKYRTQKQDGGICERLLGTLSFGTIHVLPGGTGSSPRKDRDYNPEKDALLTLSELIREVTLGICEYHDTIGGADRKSPRQRWDEYFTGSNGYPTAPAPAHDPRRFSFEILREYMRTVRNVGVQVNNIFYKSPVFSDLVGKRVRIKVDECNLSHIAFFYRNDWIEVPARGNPPETLTELHLNSAKLPRPGELGERGLAARSERNKTKTARKEISAALERSQEIAAHERETGEAPMPRTAPKPMLRTVNADRRDFTRIVAPYLGEDDEY